MVIWLIGEMHPRASFAIQAEEPFSLAVGSVRAWWNIYQVNQFNANESNTEENKKELGGKKFCKFFPRCSSLLVWYLWRATQWQVIKSSHFTFLCSPHCGSTFGASGRTQTCGTIIFLTHRFSKREHLWMWHLDSQDWRTKKTIKSVLLHLIL